MRVSEAEATLSWRERWRLLWTGNGQPSRWPRRVSLIIGLALAVNWLWPYSLRLARWASAGKWMSLGLVVMLGLAVGWLGWHLWQLLRALGVRKILVGLGLGYTLAVGLKLLTLPPEQPLLAALPGAAIEVVREGSDAAARLVAGLPEALQNFRFAYAGQRALVDLPGVIEPEQPVAGELIAPIYLTEVQTPLPAASATAEPAETPPELPASAATAAINPVAGIALGSFVVATTRGDRLRAHRTPGVETEVTARFPNGSQLRVLEGPVTAGDYRWWLVEGEAGQGWCAEPFLAPAGAAR